MRKYRLGIFTSLYDDYAVELLQRLDESIGDSTLHSEVTFVLANTKEGISDEIDQRIRKLKRLKHLKDLILFPSREFEPRLRAEQIARWRVKHDLAIMKLLPAEVDSCLALGYMQIISSEMLKALTIVNLHPAIPKIGPVGMWPKVMEEQAQRPLPYLLALKEEEILQKIPKIMSISLHKAGGMLHIATEETDRGPVIAWYEFALTSSKLDELWMNVARKLKKKSLEEVKKDRAWKQLTSQIRREQFKGEEPLILLAYKNLTRGLWRLQNKKLYIKETAYPDGYCLNLEIKEYFEQRGIESLI